MGVTFQKFLQSHTRGTTLKFTVSIFRRCKFMFKMLSCLQNKQIYTAGSLFLLKIVNLSCQVLNVVDYSISTNLSLGP